MAKSGHSVEGICSYDEPIRGIGYEPIQYRGGVVFGMVTLIGAADTKYADSLQGEWKLVESWANGTQLPAQILGDATLKVTGDRYVLKRSNGETVGKLKIDANQQPISVDIIAESKDADAVPSPGIIKIEAGKLHLCGAPPGSERPVDFDTLRRPKITVLVFTRVNKP